MKNIYFLLISLVIIFSPPSIYAQKSTLTPTAKPTDESATQNLSNQINSLKEKIASRVAQLNLVEKRGVVGTVKDVEGMKISIEDMNKKIRNVDVDEITKFSSPSAKSSFGISDIKPGTKLSVIGLYNKDSERILARFITVVSTPLTISGAVSKKDEEDFTLTVSTESGENYIVDIEKVTRTLEYTDGDIIKSGFTKIEESQRIMVIGYPALNQKNRITGTRILIFPELPRNPKIVLSATKDEIIPSTGSGKVLTPIR